MELALVLIVSCDLMSAIMNIMNNSNNNNIIIITIIILFGIVT